MSSELSIEVTLGCPHAEAIDRVTNALQDVGFGVLTRIDLHEAFKEKLGIEFPPHSILGACNPSLAHQAMLARPEVGLVMPCNVTVEQVEAGQSIVRIVNAKELLRAGELDQDRVIADVGRDAAERLQRVADALRS